MPWTDPSAPWIDDDPATPLTAARYEATLASLAAYTDSLVEAAKQGLSVKQSAVAATTTALPTNIYNNGASGVGATLTGAAFGALEIDGVALTAGERVLVKNEAEEKKNGVYTVTHAGAIAELYVLTRSTDMNSTGQFDGAFVFVDVGTVNGASGWTVASTTPIIVGTTSVVWTQFGAPAFEGNKLKESWLPPSVVRGSTALQPVSGIRPVFNILDRGAVGDGVTDDSAAINSCIEAMGVGDTLFIPAAPGGVGYFVAHQIKVTKRINILAEGRGALIFGGAGFSDSQLVNYAPSALADHLMVQNLTLELPDAHTSHLLTLSNVAHAQVSELNLVGGNRALNLGPTCYSSYFRGVTANLNNYGVYIDGDGSAAELFFSQFQIGASATSSTAGFAIVRSEGGDQGGYYLSDVLVAVGSHPCKHGFLFDASASETQSSSPIYMTKCAADSVSEDCISVKNWAAVFVQGGWMYSKGPDIVRLEKVGDSLFTGMHMPGEGNGFKFAGAASSKVQISWNRMPNVAYAYYIETQPSSLSIGYDSFDTGNSSTHLTNNLSALIAALSTDSRFSGPVTFLLEHEAGEPGALTLLGTGNNGKHLRIATDSSLQILNSAYTTTLLNLSDDGQLHLGSSAAPSLRSGAGAPASSAPAGSIYLQTDGAAGTRVYVNQNGSTSWTAIPGV